MVMYTFDKGSLGSVCGLTHCVSRRKKMSTHALDYCN